MKLLYCTLPIQIEFVWSAKHLCCTEIAEESFMSVYPLRAGASSTRPRLRRFLQIQQASRKDIESPYSVKASLSLLLGLGLLVSLFH